MNLILNSSLELEILYSLAWSHTTSLVETYEVLNLILNSSLELETLYYTLQPGVALPAW